MSVIAAGMGNPFTTPDFLLAAGLLAVVLIVGLAGILIAERWKRQAIASKEDTQSALDLAQFHELFERGEITEEEYDKIRQRTAQRLKNELRIAPPAPPAPPTGPAPPTPLS